MAAVFFKIEFILSRVVFAFDRLQNAINLKAFPFHLLVVTATLIVVSRFHEIWHDPKHFVQNGICPVFKLIPENLKKDSIFNFFFLSPMSFSFINSLFIIADLVQKKWWIVNVRKTVHFFHKSSFKKSVFLKFFDLTLI